MRLTEYMWWAATVLPMYGNQCMCMCVYYSLSVFVCIFQGVFVQLVQANTPAALAGLRFGDQLLQINGESCAGWNSDKAHKALKNASAERITLAVRDR